MCVLFSLDSLCSCGMFDEGGYELNVLRETFSSLLFFFFFTRRPGRSAGMIWLEYEHTRLSKCVRSLGTEAAEN